MRLTLLAAVLALGVLQGCERPSPDARPAACIRGTLAPEGYCLETIPIPADRPFHIAGLDINERGDVAVATRLGEVWVLPAEAAARLPAPSDWRMFAEGLSEPTGLLWDGDGAMIVGQKPELTRLEDRDGDAVADAFVRLGGDWDFHDNYHEYNFAPVRGADGALYGTLNLGHGNPDGFGWGDRAVMTSQGGYRGWAYRIGPDGAFTPYASGLRSPAGVGVSPDGQLFYTDNQGDWVPTSKLHRLEEGKFYGHPSSLRDRPGYTLDRIRKMTIKDFDAMRERPVVWFPHQEVASSPGNPEWDRTEGRFGPFAGQIFIGDQTLSNVVRVMLEEVGGEAQGAVIPFMDGFQSGNIRVRFDPKGRLWVGQTAGGWASAGDAEFGLQRVTWDGKTTPFELKAISMTRTGFRLNFTERLDPSSVSTESISVERWSYLYSDAYGSEKIRQAAAPLAAARVSDDGMSVEIDVPLETDRVFAVDFSAVRSASKRPPGAGKAYYTVNATY